MGDAAHTAHFSIGSGTKLALEDAIELANSIAAHPHDLEGALKHYNRCAQRRRAAHPERGAQFDGVVSRTCSAMPRSSRNSFAYSLLTRSQRISHENLRERDAAYLAEFENWIAQRSGIDVTDETKRPVPPMFTPFTLRGVTLKNRIVVSPMAQYSARRRHRGRLSPDASRRARDGRRRARHDGDDLRFRPKRASRRAARVSTTKRNATRGGASSSSCIASRMRSSASSSGMRAGKLRPKWHGKALTSRSTKATGQPFRRRRSNICVASATGRGRRASKTCARSRRSSCARPNSPSRPVSTGSNCTARTAILLSGFLSPLTNHRSDEYGGSLANRLRFPLEVFRAMRAIWAPPTSRCPLRISAHDWVDGGMTPDDAVEIARAFKAAGADLIDVSSGQVSKDEKPVYGPHVPDALLRPRAQRGPALRTIAVGAISEADHVNSIIAAGRADLCAIARPHLANPAWTLNEAARIGYFDIAWPKQYRAAKAQLERNYERERAQQHAKDAA